MGFIMAFADVGSLFEHDRRANAFSHLSRGKPVSTLR
jgi:hypothetical protein